MVVLRKTFFNYCCFCFTPKLSKYIFLIIWAHFPIINVTAVFAWLKDLYKHRTMYQANLFPVLFKKGMECDDIHREEESGIDPSLLIIALIMFNVPWKSN